MTNYIVQWNDNWQRKKGWHKLKDEGYTARIIPSVHGASTRYLGNVTYYHEYFGVITIASDNNLASFQDGEIWAEREIGKHKSGDE